MSSASKRKGTNFEREVITYLRQHGYPYADRPVAGASEDVGDIIGTPGVVWECKNQKIMQLALWVDELEVEIAHNLARYQVESPVTGAVIHKRRGKSSAGDYYATLPLYRYVQLLKEAGY